MCDLLCSDVLVLDFNLIMLKLSSGYFIGFSCSGNPGSIVSTTQIISELERSGRGFDRSTGDINKSFL